LYLCSVQHLKKLLFIMAKQQFKYVGILNDNPSVTADAVLANGQFTVADTGLTGRPWGGSINWVDVTSNQILPASVGAFQVRQFTTNAYAPLANTEYRVTITPDPASNVLSSTFVYRTGAVAPAIAALVTAIAAQITADSNGQYTATNVGNDLRIQGNLGALTTEVYGFSMFMNIGFAQTVVTALAQPQGTPAIIARDSGLPLSIITAATYNTYLVGFTEKVQLPSGTFEVVNNEAVVYVNDAGDAGAGTFNDGFTTIFTGVGVTADYLARP
jgi:hypothetical protein